MLNPILFIYYLDFLGMVSVFTAQDLVTGALHVGKRIVKKEHLRRERRRRSTMMRAISMASRNTKNWKWELSKYVCCCLFTSPKLVSSSKAQPFFNWFKSSLRIIEGALVIVVSFIFIVQSATAIDLWLNFAAVQFVGTLDDTAFCKWTGDTMYWLSILEHHLIPRALASFLTPSSREESNAGVDCKETG